jgi:pentatricopeptide repeat protein
MATVHEELHALIDQLSEQEAEIWLKQMQEAVHETQPSEGDWHARMRRLRAELYAKYGKVTDAASVLEEMREERLNDIMGSR